MTTTSLPGNLIPFLRRGTPAVTHLPAPKPAGGVRLLERSELLERLDTLGELAPNGALSFLVAHVRPENGSPQGRRHEQVLQSLARLARELLRPTDALGEWTGTSLAVVLQGSGPAAASAVASRLSFHMNQYLADQAPGYQVAVYAASGRGFNAQVLPAAALESLGDCS